MVIPVGRKCVAFKCQNLAKAGMLCSMHYKRVQRHGDVNHRKNSSGLGGYSRAKDHPLYRVWRAISRSNLGKDICEKWKKFETFVADVVEIPPETPGFRRKDTSKPFGPGNIYWALPYTDRELKVRSKEVRKWVSSNPEYRKDNHLKQHYGVDLEWYNQQFEKQHGVCAICKKPETLKIRGKTHQLAVDHCHDTKKVRGLLCTACNRGIGMLKHDVALLKSAIKYLNK